MDEKVKAFQKINEKYHGGGKISAADFDVIEQIYTEWYKFKIDIFNKKTGNFVPQFDGKHCNMALCRFIKRVYPGRHESGGLKYFCEKHGEFLETEHVGGVPKRLRVEECR